MFLSTSFSISVYSITGRLAISKMQRRFSSNIADNTFCERAPNTTPTSTVLVGTFPPAQKGI